MGTEGRREAREDSAEGPGSPGAESETFRTRTCWSQCCHCSPAGQVSVITGTRTCWSQCCHCSPHGTGQRDHRAPGAPPAPRHGDTLKKHLPLAPRTLLGFKQVLYKYQ